MTDPSANHRPPLQASNASSSFSPGDCRRLAARRRRLGHLDGNRRKSSDHGAADCDLRHRRQGVLMSVPANAIVAPLLTLGDVAAVYGQHPHRAPAHRGR